MEGKRQYLLDGLRGLTLISMILYHGMFDLLEIYGVHVSWFWRLPGIIWQQSICWSFIILSGFCWNLSRNPVKNGLVVSAGGLLVSAVTWIFMPEERITFGILTFLGSAMLLLVLLKPLLEHIPSVLGFLGNAVLFFLVRDVNAGYWGTEAFHLGEVPKSWYQGWISTFLGFPPEDFFSGDYFSLVPWMFLYLSGYFLYDIVIEKKSFQKLMEVRIKPLEWIGRRSLLIYLLHQPVVLLGLEAFWCVKDMLFKGYGI
ncbi:MAG: heparan-alpha-glucosaminide N-acetyltransferase domain-containing protein [Lachnospiraceae bacterium]